MEAQILLAAAEQCRYAVNWAACEYALVSKRISSHSSSGSSDKCGDAISDSLSINFDLGTSEGEPKIQPYQNTSTQAKEPHIYTLGFNLEDLSWVGSTTVQRTAKLW